MSKMLKIELKKALFSKTFLLGTALLTLFALCSALYMIEGQSNYNPNHLYEYCMDNGEYVSNPDFPLVSLYTSWVGADRVSLAYALFFNLMPIGAAIPFAWSYHTERKCGYLKNIATRIDRKYYYISKTIAVFVSGSLAVFIPYIINILLVSAFIPYYQPWIGYNLYNMVYFGTTWSDLFFSYPLLHMILYVILNTVYGGIFALLSYSISFYIRNYVAILFTPFLLILVSGYVETTIYNNFFQNTYTLVEFVPTQFLHSRSIHYQVMSWAVILVTVLLIAFIFATIYYKGKKNEIY